MCLSAHASKAPNQIFHTALTAALRKLGFKVYDFVERYKADEITLWDNALRAKFFGNGRPWGRKEFDEVTGSFNASSHASIQSAELTCKQCILDTPCCFFVEELSDAYPEAKVVLNKRNVDKWLVSMQKTIFRVMNWPSWRFLRYTDRNSATWLAHMELTWKVFCNNDYGDKCKQRFIEHNEHVRNVVPKDRLLEYEVSDGWGPLCAFLNVQEPDEPFPNVYDTQKYLERADQTLWRPAVRRLLQYIVTAAITSALIVGAAVIVLRG